MQIPTAGLLTGHVKSVFFVIQFLSVFLRKIDYEVKLCRLKHFTEIAYKQFIIHFLQKTTTE